MSEKRKQSFEEILCVFIVVWIGIPVAVTLILRLFGSG